MDCSDFFLSLTDEEKTHIAAVLQKDVDEQNRQKKKVGLVKLKIDLLTEKRYNLSTSAESKKGFKNGTICSLCGFTFPNHIRSSESEVRKLREILPAIAICSYCKLKICQGCCNKTNTVKLSCRLCYLKREYAAITGIWCKTSDQESHRPQQQGINADVDQVLSISNLLLSQFKKSDRRSSVVSGVEVEKELGFIAKDIRASEKLHSVSGSRKLLTVDNVSQNPFDVDDDSTESINEAVSSTLSEKVKSALNLSLHASKRSLGAPNQFSEIFTWRGETRPIEIQAASYNRISELEDENILNGKMPENEPVNYYPRHSKESRLCRSSQNSSEDRSYVESNDDISVRMGSCSSLNSTSIVSAPYDELKDYNPADINVAGHVLLSVKYECSSATLNVIILRCKDLIGNNDRKRHLNPYIKVYLLPDISESGKRKTKCKRGTDNPVFNETLRYQGLTKAEVERRALYVSVWQSDLFGKNKRLGDVIINLCDYQWASDDAGKWFILEMRRKVNIIQQRIKNHALK